MLIKIQITCSPIRPVCDRGAQSRIVNNRKYVLKLEALASVTPGMSVSYKYLKLPQGWICNCEVVDGGIVTSAMAFYNPVKNAKNNAKDGAAKNVLHLLDEQTPVQEGVEVFDDICGLDYDYDHEDELGNPVYPRKRTRLSDWVVMSTSWSSTTRTWWSR